jgi:3-oxoacyl-[acyl-carrier protein] reductase
VREESAADYALWRFSTAQDVANVIAFLCSDKSRQITGQDIAVDGGWAM